MKTYPVAIFGFLLCASLVAILAGVSVRIAPESAPVARGAATTGVYACLECHGREDDGFPDDWSLACNRQQNKKAEPHYIGLCEDFLAFFAAVRVRHSFSKRLAAGSANNRLLAGERLARMFYCFQCHGELGQGGFPNTGALKGYIPGYFGDDFLDLTNEGSPVAVKAWIRDGINPDMVNKFIEGPIAMHFINRQAIQMPQFNHLSEFELGLLIDYVLALNELGPMDAAAVRKYAKLTQSPLPTGRKSGLLHYTGMQH